jgi:hypothetical protein
MNILTAEEIAAMVESLSGQAERRAINQIYRTQDESHLWPIHGRFNATNRAIRRARDFERESGVALYGLEYCYILESALSDIVNGAI